jgi:hypothetical protein
MPGDGAFSPGQNLNSITADLNVKKGRNVLGSPGMIGPPKDKVSPRQVARVPMVDEENPTRALGRGQVRILGHMLDNRINLN